MAVPGAVNPRNPRYWLGALLALGAVPAGAGAAQNAAPVDVVQAVMRGVDFHIDASIVLRIDYLRGHLVPSKTGVPPWFDDKHSFSFAIDTARVSLSGTAISDLLNRYVFHYAGAPLRGLRISVEGRQIRQRGRMGGIPFNILSDVTVNPAGELVLRAVSIKAFGIGVTGLLERLGMSLNRMMDLRKAKGVRAEKNDLLISPTAIVPPPLIQGHLAAVELRDSVLVQIFRPARGTVPPPLPLPDSSAVNYMYYRGSTLKFVRLTMTPADLLIVDANPSDPFDFFMERYQEQLVAGYSRNTRAGGLITVMPDYRKVRR